MKLSNEAFFLWNVTFCYFLSVWFALIRILWHPMHKMQSIQLVFVANAKVRFLYVFAGAPNGIHLVKIAHREGMQYTIYRLCAIVPVWQSYCCENHLHLGVFFSPFPFCSFSLSCSRSFNFHSTCSLWKKNHAKTATWMSFDDNIANRNCNKYLNKNEAQR